MTTSLKLKNIWRKLIGMNDDEGILYYIICLYYFLCITHHYISLIYILVKEFIYAADVGDLDKLLDTIHKRGVSCIDKYGQRPLHRYIIIYYNIIFLE